MARFQWPPPPLLLLLLLLLLPLSSSFPPRPHSPPVPSPPAPAPAAAPASRRAWPPCPVAIRVLIRCASEHIIWGLVYTHPPTQAHMNTHIYISAHLALLPLERLHLRLQRGGQALAVVGQLRGEEEGVRPGVWGFEIGMLVCRGDRAVDGWAHAHIPPGKAHTRT